MVMPNNTYNQSGIILLALLLLTGCSNDLADLEAYVEKVKMREPAPIEPIPTIKPYVCFIYPSHENDPFSMANVTHETIAEQEVVKSVKVDENRTREFLESFPLDSLRMVGTVRQNNELWALVQIPNGTIHRVHRGNYLGLNRGKILNIEEARINLLEIVDNGSGGFKEQENSVALFDPKNKG